MSINDREGQGPLMDSPSRIDELLLSALSRLEARLDDQTSKLDALVADVQKLKDGQSELRDAQDEMNGKFNRAARSQKNALHDLSIRLEQTEQRSLPPVEQVGPSVYYHPQAPATSLVESVDSFRKPHTFRL